MKTDNNKEETNNYQEETKEKNKNQLWIHKLERRKMKDERIPTIMTRN